MSEVACRYVGIDLGAWACASPTLGRRSTTFHSSDSLTLFCLSVFSFCNVVSERVRMEDNVYGSVRHCSWYETVSWT
jgi:hypothetical protein